MRSLYEVTLGIAQELSGSIRTLRNLPGSITYLFDKTAEQFDADYIPWPIDEIRVNDAVNFIEQVVESIHHILT
ncbi:hypothetical protein [Lyngbya sp. CCY1209]|jgi:hypothetical protein|uniref:hypothetical protein n=1 Tax=Lyngbya sp. CCY1209 TaxID=2886103 RepID=UPI002D208C57|nr:hypothetical protein [Lyngbya sp. CCY1209]MEB3886888.1 hypothetical protein [Lyngbya sp. CCY1209]